MRIRTYTAKALLVWITVFAILCAGLRVVGTPLPLFVWMVSWAVAVWLAVMSFHAARAQGDRAAVSALFGAIALRDRRGSRHGSWAIAG